jgi:cytochrome P450
VEGTVNSNDFPPPPGPRLPALAQTALFYRDAPRLLEHCQRRYGDLFTLSFVGIGKFVYVARPELAQQVFAADRDIGRAGEARRPFLEPLVGESSILCLEGAAWERQRQLIKPAFHGERVTRWREEIAAIAARAIQDWPTGQPFELRPRMQAITLEVILRVVFGIRDAQRMERLGALLSSLVEMGGSPVVAGVPALRSRLERSRLLRRLPGNPLPRFMAMRAEADELLFEEIAGRREALAQGEERNDVLSLLLEARDEEGQALSDGELRDELVTLLVAGHETTATALAWAFERLVRAPAVMGRLLEELEAEQEEYLEAVIKETLRSRPVVIDTPRVLAEPLEIGAYRIPAGWSVAPALTLIQREPGLFPEPDAFRPERFLAEDPPVRGWMPFGGGRRRCLGSQLALLELRTVIPEVLRRIRLWAPDPAAEGQLLRGVTLVPSKLATLVAEPVA